MKLCSLCYEQRSCIMQQGHRQQPDHTQSFKLDSMDMRNWSLKWSLMRFGWAQVASPGKCVWFSQSCILCIFIGYRVRKILIMHGLNFSPGYIRGFNCSGEKRLTQIIQLLSQQAQTMAVSKPFIGRANSNLMTVLFYHKMASNWP